MKIVGLILIIKSEILILAKKKREENIISADTYSRNIKEESFFGNMKTNSLLKEKWFFFIKCLDQYKVLFFVF